MPVSLSSSIIGACFISSVITSFLLQLVIKNKSTRILNMKAFIIKRHRTEISSMLNYIKLLFYCNVVYTKIRRSIESIYRIDIRSFKIEFYTLHIRYINIPICPCSYGGHCWFIISVVGQQFRYSGDQISIYVITFDVDLEISYIVAVRIFQITQRCCNTRCSELITIIITP